MFVSRHLDRSIKRAAERVLVKDNSSWAGSRAIMNEIGKRVNSDGRPLVGKYVGIAVRHINPDATQSFRAEAGRSFRVWEGVRLI